MRGLILTNAYSESSAELNQPERLKEELSLLGAETELKRNDFFAAHIAENGIVSRVRDFDFCVYFDKDGYIASMLEKTGLRLFNSARSIRLCDDKFLTYLALQGKVPLIETYPAPLCYTPSAVMREEGVKILETLSYPIIVKECYGSQGKGVYLVHDREELEQTENELRFKPHIYQRFVAESAGRDLRVIVIGGRAIGAMKRTGSDFRSNIGSGGTGEAVPLDEEAIAVSEKAASCLGLDYCGVDLLFGKDGYLLCEVNSNAFFENFEKATKINVARLYAEHILRSLKIY